MKRSVRTFAVLLCSLLIAASITATALAAPTEPTGVNIADGSITIGVGTYTQGTGSAETIPEGGLVITGTSNSNTITVDPGDGETAAFTISGLTLSTATGASLIYVWYQELNGELKPSDITTGSSRRVWWQCEFWHVWRAAVYSRTGAKKCGCPVCAGTVRKKLSCRSRNV